MGSVQLWNVGSSYNCLVPKERHKPSLPALDGAISVKESWLAVQPFFFFVFVSLFSCKATSQPQDRGLLLLSGAAKRSFKGRDKRYARKLWRTGSAPEVHNIRSRCFAQCDSSCSVTHSKLLACWLARATRGGGPHSEYSLPGSRPEGSRAWQQLVLPCVECWGERVAGTLAVLNSLQVECKIGLQRFA